MNPALALTQPDPYPGYAELVAERPGYLDTELDAVVLSGADLVRAALADPALRVRPATAPVPAGLVGTPAGQVFGQLVRMTDGPLQQRLTAVVGRALGQVEPAAVRSETAQAFTAMPTLTDVMFRLPAQVVAGLCGLTDGADAQAARWIGEFVLCLPATATPDQQARAAVAAENLQLLLGQQLNADSPGLLGELVRAARQDDWTETAPLLANAVGLLSQTYDATAGLIGNVLVALARQGIPEQDLAGFVREVARHDSPVHNTRRFVAEPTAIGNLQLEPGDTVLVLLAAANRDPAANPEPAEFRPGRDPMALFTFGSARHGCPGERLALGIATEAVARLLAGGLVPAAMELNGYRPSGNIRCPEFAGSDQAFCTEGAPA